MDKYRKLAELKQDLENRKDIPLIKQPTDVVFGDGNINARIMFIGEAAGYHESVERKPFVGQAGKLLVRVLKEKLNLGRDDVYISNIVKTRPPENRDPLPEEIEDFRPYLDSEIDIICPDLIVTLGRFSMRKFFGENVTISRIHGMPRKITWNGREILVFPMYHPAAALRQGSVLRDFENDFRKLREIIDGPKQVAEPAEKPNETKKTEEPKQQQLGLV